MKLVPLCPICGQGHQQQTISRMAACSGCGREYAAETACPEGHALCPSCLFAACKRQVVDVCLALADQGPVEAFGALAALPFVPMHGPQHHYLTAAALLTGWRAAGGDVDLPVALEAALNLGSGLPPAICGAWGACGAAVSAGIFVSLVTGATPMSNVERGQANQATGQALQRIARIGGPRCCKRESLLSIFEAADLAARELGVFMRLPEQIRCAYHERNADCLKERCPFFPQEERGQTGSA